MMWVLHLPLLLRQVQDSGDIAKHDVIPLENNLQHI
jgi:hypothetical protein